MKWIHIKDRVPNESDARETGRILVHLVDGSHTGEFDCWGLPNSAGAFAAYHEEAKIGYPVELDYWAAIPAPPRSPGEDEGIH
jgi:hypothetical protein